MDKKVSIKSVKNNSNVRELIENADRCMEAIGYTEHGLRHTDIVSRNAYKILKELDYDERTCELASIASYLHDIGNGVSRMNHPQTGALLAKGILKDMGMEYKEIIIIMSAIGNHDETYGGHPIDVVSAATIIADKSDVHRSRVRSTEQLLFDIHDRVNYAATSSSLNIDKDKKIITLALKIDTEISQIMEYFEIFLSRMIICKKAAKTLNCKFKLEINEHSLL